MDDDDDNCMEIDKSETDLINSDFDSDSDCDSVFSDVSSVGSGYDPFSLVSLLEYKSRLSSRILENNSDCSSNEPQLCGENLQLNEKKIKMNVSHSKVDQSLKVGSSVDILIKDDRFIHLDHGEHFKDISFEQTPGILPSITNKSDESTGKSETKIDDELITMKKYRIKRRKEKRTYKTTME